MLGRCVTSDGIVKPRIMAPILKDIPRGARTLFNLTGVSLLVGCINGHHKFAHRALLEAGNQLLAASSMVAWTNFVEQLLHLVQ